MEEWRRVLIAAVPLLSVCMLLARVRGDDDAEARGRMAEDGMTNFAAPGAKAWHAETAARASSALKRRLAGISRRISRDLTFETENSKPPTSISSFKPVLISACLLSSSFPQVSRGSETVFRRLRNVCTSEKGLPPTCWNLHHNRKKSAAERL